MAGPALASKLPQARKPYHNYLNEPERKTMFVTPTSPSEIIKIIDSLKAKRALVLMELARTYLNNSLIEKSWRSLLLI